MEGVRGGKPPNALDVRGAVGRLAGLTHRGGLTAQDLAGDIALWPVEVGGALEEFGEPSNPE